MKQAEIDRLVDVICDGLIAPDVIALITAVEEAPNVFVITLEQALTEAGYYQ